MHSLERPDACSLSQFLAFLTLEASALISFGELAQAEVTLKLFCKHLNSRGLRLLCA